MSDSTSNTAASDNECWGGNDRPAFDANNIEEALLMSVPERLRALSAMQFYHNAIQLRAEIIEFAYSAAIPKSLRGAFSVPMCQTATHMVNKIVEGDNYYPNTQENVDKRKECYTQAMACIDSLCIDMQTLAAHQRTYQISKVKISKIGDLAEKCTEEIKLLKGARKNVVLRASKN